VAKSSASVNELASYGLGLGIARTAWVCIGGSTDVSLETTASLGFENGVVLADGFTTTLRPGFTARRFAIVAFFSIVYWFLLLMFVLKLPSEILTFVKIMSTV
jgi:hypothetical protein